MPSRPKNETPEQRAKRLKRQREYQARKLAKDPDGERARQRAHSAAYRAAHPEKTKAATKNWRQNNRARFNERRREWRSKNLIRALLLEAKSRAKARGVEFSIAVADVPEMGTHCPLLGHPFPPAHVRRTRFSPSIDRIDSMLGYVPGNVWVVGYRANLIKSDGTAAEHAAIAAAMRSQAARRPMADPMALRDAMDRLLARRPQLALRGVA